MSGTIQTSGKWRIKPSGKLPIFLRFMINSSFTKEFAQKANLKNHIPNRVFLNHMMYWPAKEYEAFENEILNHLEKNDGWIEKYCRKELQKSHRLYEQGEKLKKIDWSKKSNKEIEKILIKFLEKYREMVCPWYAQYTIDLYFEKTIENHLKKYISVADPNFRNYVLIFTDPKNMTEVAEERWQLMKLAKKFKNNKEKLNNLLFQAQKELQKHLDKFAYINRGLATSRPYNKKDMISRIMEAWQKKEGLDVLIRHSSPSKLKKDYENALKEIKPKADFKKTIEQARLHSFVRNKRVEAFFFADFGASFLYHEVARRNKFEEDWIMEVSIPEFIDSLNGKSLPNIVEMQRRFKNYAMVVKNANTTLITDPKEIKKLEQKYYVKIKKVKILHGNMACLGGIIKGRAKVCLNKSEISKVKRGNILVSQFTTPDFVPAMERAAAVVADQGGLSSHAAIVSRELGVPCVIGTKNGTRLIKDNDLLEIDAQKGVVKIL
jgi:phosphohistidine swiveling domain-containing protein